jgi:hypothetical protein
MLDLCICLCPPTSDDTVKYITSGGGVEKHLLIVEGGMKGEAVKTFEPSW